MEEDDITIERNSSKDEFHLIRVPKEFDIRKLHGIEYSPHEVLEIEAAQGKDGVVTIYELAAFSGEGIDLNMLIKSGQKIVAGPSLSQSLCVNKTFNFANMETTPIRLAKQYMANEAVTFPEGLRERFTPIGSGTPSPRHREKVKSSKTKRKRSPTASTASDDDGSSSSPSKKRHKQHDGGTQGEEQNVTASRSRAVKMEPAPDHEIVSLNSTPSIDKVKKKRKRKSEIGNDGDNDSSISHSNLNSLVNGLNGTVDEKLDILSSELVIDGPADESLTEETKKKKKRRSKLDDTEQCPAADESLTEETKTKKKKKKHSKEDDSEKCHDADESLTEDTKKKKKKHSKVDEMEQYPDTPLTVHTLDESKEKKKKKKKREKEEV